MGRATHYPGHEAEMCIRDRIYGADNMDRLLFERHLGQKVRRAGGRTRGVKKRTAEMDMRFEKALKEMLQNNQEGMDK